MEMFRRAPIVAVGVVFSAALLSGAAQDEVAALGLAGFAAELHAAAGTLHESA